jgi:hypothetical protein
MKQVSLSRYLYLKIKRIIMAAIIEEFNEYRSRMHHHWQQQNKRIFNLDTNAYA